MSDAHRVSGELDLGIDPAGAGAAPEPAGKPRAGPRAPAGGSHKPKRSRAPAGAAAASETPVALDLSAFTGMIVGLSTMLALRTGFAQIEAGEDEVKQWLRAAQKVARHYSVKTTQKALDWIAFSGISAQVWGTRAVAVVVEANNRREGEAPPRRGPAEIRHLRPVPAAPAAPTAEASPPSVPPAPGIELGVEPEGGF